ncbi:MAG: type II toxin-antitoxin system PemK/MazF family toxin [Acidimicrobiales bacterium]
MVDPRQGDIWWATLDRHRPVLIVTRSDAAAFLQRFVVAPVTRTVRGIPTEIPLGPAEGLPDNCAASFDNLQTVLRQELTDKAGQLGLQDRDKICAALEAMADC